MTRAGAATAAAMERALLAANAGRWDEAAARCRDVLASDSRNVHVLQLLGVPRLFRQAAAGDWAGVVGRVRDALAAQVASPCGTSGAGAGSMQG